MYIPKLYKNEDLESAKEYIKENSFGILITTQENGAPWATHIPMELRQITDGKDILVGHISKANPQWKSFENQTQVLTIFSAHHSYVSSSWYNHSTTVPTWNYVAVHAYGTIKILSTDELYQSLVRLVDKYEQVAKEPIDLDRMPEKVVKREMRGIVGFEIEITEMHAKQKLSQNRHEEDYKNIIKELRNLGDANSEGIADKMEGLVE
jgi:transcriptional regulator